MKRYVMKKIYFVLAFITACNARAQYTLTASSNPVVGDIYQYYLMDTAGFTFGSTGTGQVWNYTNLVVSYPNRVTVTYTTVASTASASTFPAANIASEASLPAGSLTYYTISATERSLVGEAFINNGDVRLNTNPVAFCVLPFSYGSSAVSTNFTGSSVFSLYAGPSVNYSGVMTINAEGTGTLLLPDGLQYSNTLKIKTVETYTLAGFGIVNTKTVCEWYSAASKFPLLSLCLTTSYDGVGSTFTHKQVFMNTGVDVGLRESADTKAEFSIYPNPSRTEVFVDFETSPEKSYSIDIVDMQGRIRKKATFRSVKNGMQHDRIDLSGLSTGTYFVKLRNNEGKEGVRQLVIE